MSEPRPNSDLTNVMGTLTATALPLAIQRRFAHVVSSPRRLVASWLAAMLGCAQLPGRREFAGLRPATRFLIVGFAAWIALVGLATMIAVALMEISTMSLPAWFGSRAAASPSTEIRPPAGFENILSRPLFSRSRQAGPVAVLASAPPSLPVTLDRGITLKGVFISGELAKAFMTSAQDPLGVWVQANEEISGWRVVSVKREEVLLDGQNEKLVVQLSVNGSTK